MKVTFKRANSIDYHNYCIYINDEQYTLNDELNLILDASNNSFYIKTYWFKTQIYELDLLHNECVINIEFIISKRQYFILMALFAIFITLSIAINNYAIWTVTACLSSLWLLFQIYIYSIGYKKYIKTNIKYLD